MPVPVISKTQSVLGFRQWSPWVFQPTATNTPTLWSCTALPPGVVFDPTTGRIQGPATMPGVYTFIMQAQNVDGVSAPETFALGIEATGYVQPSNILECCIETTTKQVFFGAAPTSTTSTPDTAGTLEDAKKVPPLWWMKAGDDVLLNVRFLKNGVIYDPALTALKFALKQYEPEGVLFGSDGTFARIGSGADASFRIYTKVESPELRAALTDYEDDEATVFKSLGEFEWVETNNYTPTIGPATLRGSSRTFGVWVPRDLIANP